MGDLQATTLAGRGSMLSAAAVAAFQQSLRGSLIAPDDALCRGPPGLKCQYRPAARPDLPPRRGGRRPRRRQLRP